MTDRRLGVLQAEKLRSCKFPSSMKTPCEIASLLTGFYDCGVIEGHFARTKIFPSCKIIVQSVAPEVVTSISLQLILKTWLN